MGRSFRRAAAEADQLIEREAMPAAAVRRVRERLATAPSHRLSWALAAAGAAAAGAVALALLLRPPAPEPEALAPERIAAMTVAERTPDLATRVAGAALEVVAGAAVIVDEEQAFALGVRAGVSILREPSGIRVQRGRVEVAVAKRPAPFRVLVSHGCIEVLGTSFTVTQGASGGEVALHEGSIRFVGDDGGTQILAPGQSLAWPRSKAPAPNLRVHAPRRLRPRPTAPAKEPLPEPPPEEPVEKKPPPVDAAVLLRRIAELRSRHRYDEAVALLQGALREPRAKSTRERLSFEQGSLLTFQIEDAERACAHWSGHVAEFGLGRYEREIAQARAEIRCQ